MANILAFLAVFAAMATATVNESDAPQNTTASFFCWKHTYTRGVGRVPGSCAAGQEPLGLFCYDKCPAGMTRVGFDCHSKCPGWLEDQGLFCRYREYGRGWGFPWRLFEPLDSRGMLGRCQSWYGKGNCEVYGLMAYPKCLPGYYPFGCCICRPSPPDCDAIDMAGRFDLSCAKKITIGTPHLGTCAANEDLDVGLCYPKCKPTYKGIGPVCWGRPPPLWEDCGMGAAVTSSHCAAVIANQVLSVVVLAANIASRFAGSSVKVLTSIANPAQVSKLRSLWYKALPYLAKKVLPKVVKYFGTNVGTMAVYHNVFHDDNATFTNEDFARTAIALVAVMDKSGILDVVAADMFPMCDKIEGILNGHG
ncbi:hypothetical protein H257_19369 [Aphanomyces astaci]|uniref:Uncharacterized protein n=1 Tax=Aphanomyces astaci TaxID=112090 RepID=W4F9V8_APHAT|nr:hypothetical protein H257_19369 [Aphanomyces astaci]ETV63699.1 hypothetical protein H257_19369 [Aphanomyces astaci]|eukprot:XP_009846817.1 hypothetical protein H257_19369 [Aphanomyces astaci]